MVPKRVLLWRPGRFEAEGLSVAEARVAGVGDDHLPPPSKNPPPLLLPLLLMIPSLRIQETSLLEVHRDPDQTEEASAEAVVQEALAEPIKVMPLPLIPPQMVFLPPSLPSLPRSSCALRTEHPGE